MYPAEVESALMDLDGVLECDLRARIAACKIPKHIEFPAALPRTTSGKILRRALRERMARRG